MKRRQFAIAAGLALCLLPLGPAAAQTVKPWVHVHVTEGDEGTNVQVNLPLGAVQAALAAAPAKVIEKGRMKLQEADISVADLRKMWQELREAGDAEFVTVEEKDQQVRIARQGSVVLIRIIDRASDQPKVRVEVPVRVVDALLEGEGSELNLEAAIRQLHSERGELIQVEDGKTRVRVWIDERS
jgi:hypothetical protein